MKTERLARKTKMIYLQWFQTPNTCKTSKYTPINLRLAKSQNLHVDAKLADISFLSENQYQSCNEID